MCNFRDYEENACCSKKSSKCKHYEFLRVIVNYIIWDMNRTKLKRKGEKIAWGVYLHYIALAVFFILRTNYAYLKLYY